MPVQILAAGDNATLVELGEVTAAELHAAAASVRAREGVIAVIPGHSSLYVIGSVERQALSLTSSGGLRARRSTTHRVRVNFDGPDRPPGFVPRALTLTVRYLGFRGGFGYLDGWPEEWAMPRRPTSRPVGRGSLAVAGSVAGFYPIDTPGGWNILGHTDADLFHALAPGDTIVIEPTDEPLPLPAVGGLKPALHLDYAEIVSAPLATWVSAPDWTGVERGLSPGGPFDDLAAALANRAVGNAAEAPLLECAMTGPRLRFTRDGFVSWLGEMRRVRAGEEIAFGRVTDGLRGYLAFGEREESFSVTRGERHVIRAMRGPHDVGIERVECEVTPQLDRVGIRLRPLQPFGVEAPADLRSIGMQCGTIQLHPDGSLVAMGPDHPVTGGYLQPMTVLSGERWKLAQLAPGERVTFVAQPPY